MSNPSGSLCPPNSIISQCPKIDNADSVQDEKHAQKELVDGIGNTNYDGNILV